MDDEGFDYGSKTIVVHVGSQNMRIGLATDALPKTVPMVIAKKSARSEADDSEPRPKRLKLDDNASSEEWFGDDVGLSMSDASCHFANDATVRVRIQRHGTGLQDL